MEVDNTFFKKAVKVFTQAPDYFYSPSGRKLLTQEEIEVRTCFCVQSFIKISQKEIVFRRFWEISILPKDDWDKAFKVALEFLGHNKISHSLVLKLINELIKEIEFLNEHKGRIIHNPF
ncbi:hypothetical protein [Tenacibaculum sp.]|uniref:hypothetical protein n=1 Tax=Tenacibaculum sp. TaxID=1906242 RepID=UPI003D10D46D